MSIIIGTKVSETVFLMLLFYRKSIYGIKKLLAVPSEGRIFTIHGWKSKHPDSVSSLDMMTHFLLSLLINNGTRRNKRKFLRHCLLFVF